MAKKQKLTKDFDKGIVRIDYPTIRKNVQVAVADLSEDVKVAALFHGLGQKLGDAKSGATPAEKFEMARRVADSLLAGSWDLTTRVDDGQIVVEAVARIKGETIEKVRAVIEKLGEDGPERIKEWRAAAKVKAMIAQIRAERAKEAAEDADDEEIEL